MQARDRRFMLLEVVLLFASVGCAATTSGVKTPTGHGASLIHEWNALGQLSGGTRVQVTLDPYQFVDARLRSVDDRGLVVTGKGGSEVLARSSVVSVVKVESSSDAAQRGVVVGLAVGVGGWVACRGNQPPGTCWSSLYLWTPLVSATLAVLFTTDTHRVLVYERP